MSVSGFGCPNTVITFQTLETSNADLAHSTPDDGLCQRPQQAAQASVTTSAEPVSCYLSRLHDHHMLGALFCELSAEPVILQGKLSVSPTVMPQDQDILKQMLSAKVVCTDATMS